jgi:ribose 5-phosphate isomerase A
MSHEAKMAAGRKAVEWINSGMIVGLGSGSTAECFIHSLIDACKQGLHIQAVSSSRASADLATKGGIEVVDINSVPRIDITVDGADEIDVKKRMIKGGGGAHVREKILASSSDEMVVIIDDRKLVPSVGRGKLPVEILFYGSPATRMKVEELGYRGRWRMNEDETLFISENGNLILDLHFDKPPQAPEQLHEAILNIPGVIDTGFFFNLAGRVIIGYPDGKVQIH